MPKTTKKVRSYAEVIHRINNLKKLPNNFAIIKLGQIHCPMESYDMFCIRTDTSVKSPLKICLSAGIHGDEPAGVEAILAFLENFRQYAELLEGVEAIILPCDNPFGYERNIRSNADGLDLNREFQDSNRSQEIHLIKKAVRQHSFDIALDFHEDVDGEGFYLWERKSPALKSIGGIIIQRISQKYSIDRRSEIEGFPNRQGVISLDRYCPEEGWPKTYYLSQNGTKYCLTLETPTNLSLQARVEMHLLALKTSLQGDFLDKKE